MQLNTDHKTLNTYSLPKSVSESFGVVCQRDGRKKSNVVELLQKLYIQNPRILENIVHI